MTRAAIVLALALAAVPAIVLFAHRVAPAQTEQYLVARSEAFLAFYCAGGIAASGGNPYRIQPLMDCEHAHGEIIAAGLVEPAPLPTYALWFFSWFRALPYVAAAMTWATILLMALVLATWALARTTGLPWYLIAAAFAPNAAHLNVRFGELPPVCIGALSLAAYLLAQRRPAGAALAATGMMIEPHVGLAACLGLFCFVPKTRLPLALTGTLFAIAGIAFAGWATTAEFFATVLPAHARSELLAFDQYSLSWVLYALGCPAQIALRAGTLSYLVMLAVGLLLARRWATALRSPELIVAVPAAAVLIGGVFIHDIQMAIALPAAIVIAARCRAAFRPLAFLGITLIAIPWGVLFTPQLLPFLSLTALAVIAFDGRFGQAAATRATAVAAGAAVIFLFVFMAPRASSQPAFAWLRDPAAQASANWQQHVEIGASPNTPASVARKLLVWSGFAAVALAAAGSKRTDSRRRPLEPGPTAFGRTIG